MSRQPLGRRVHQWLNEPKGETFVDGKWRFWFIAVAGLQLLNAALTALIFDSAGNLQNYMGAVLLGAGALVGWIAIGCLHYSDSGDRRLAQGVSALDSITLLFVVAHFAFLMWTYGHLKTIQSAEAKYEVAVEKHNAEARQVQAGNEKIAEALAKVAEADKQRARIENDTVYQARKAAEAGVRIAPRRSAAASASLSTSPVELAKAPDPPKDTAADFLTRWDSWIRLANFGELLLAALTLIFIRNRTASVNSPVENFAPMGVGISTIRTPAPVGNLTTKKEIAKKHTSFDPEGLKRLREALKDISFRLKGLSFKASVSGDAVWVVMVRANQGTQETVASAKAKLDILDDAMTMPREAFRERLEKFLRENSFEI